MIRHGGLVVELGKGLAVVLTPDGQFKRVRAKAGWQLGDEVRLDNVVALPRRRPVTLTWVAAAAIILAMLLPGALSVRALFGQTALAAYVAVDINPSLELQVSSAGKVLAADAVNDDARQLLQAMQLQGLPLDQAVQQITEKAIAAGYLTQTGDNMVLITVTPSAKDGSLAASVTQRVQASEQAVQAVLKSHQLPNAVETLTAPAEIRETARNQGLSTGKLLVAGEAAADGVNITSEQLKDQSLGKILSDELKSADPADKRAVVNDFLARVKGKDHGDQKDKVKAVDDLVRTWKAKSDKKSESDGEDGNKAPDRKDSPPAKSDRDSKKSDGHDSNSSQSTQKSEAPVVAPVTQSVAPAGTADAGSSDKGKVAHGKGRKDSTVADAGWPAQFREFFERIFGKVASVGSGRED